MNGGGAGAGAGTGTATGTGDWKVTFRVALVIALFNFRSSANQSAAQKKRKKKSACLCRAISHPLSFLVPMAGKDLQMSCWLHAGKINTSRAAWCRGTWCGDGGGGGGIGGYGVRMFGCKSSDGVREAHGGSDQSRNTGLDWLIRMRSARIGQKLFRSWISYLSTLFVCPKFPLYRAFSLLPQDDLR